MPACGQARSSLWTTQWIESASLWITATTSRRSRSFMNMRGRLMLLPGLRRVWRDENALQLGTNPAHALVIEVAHRSVARVLDLLDGSRTMLGVVREAAECNVPEETVS